MKILSRVFFALLLCLSLAPMSFAVDTLQVFALRIQFQEEKTDNSLTTGVGLFDIEKKDKNTYSLDPPGRRGTAGYWLKHFEFAKNYYSTVSGGNVVIDARIFPDPSSGSTAYTLDKALDFEV